MRNTGLDEAQAGIKIARRNINNLRYADDTTLMAESEEELKSLLMKAESEKVGLKLNIQKTNIMASSPITLWEIDEETVETVSDFILGGFKIIPSKDIPGLISFRMDWLDPLAVQGTLKSLLQHHTSKALILRCSAFFTVQLS